TSTVVCAERIEEVPAMNPSEPSVPPVRTGPSVLFRLAFAGLCLATLTLGATTWYVVVKAQEHAAEAQRKAEEARTGAREKESDPVEARRLLDDANLCPPGLRDFTWGLYNRWSQRGKIGPEAMEMGKGGARQGLLGGWLTLALSPDGRTLALGCGDGRILLFD